MHRHDLSAALALMLAIAVAGCGDPAPTLVDRTSQPTPAMTPASSAPSIPPTFAPGAATLKVTGVLFKPCIPPPSGCDYDVTLTGDDGPTMTVRLDYTADYAAQVAGRRTPMTPEGGLPPTLAQGDYVVVFQSLEFADDAKPVPLPSGGTGYPPVVREGCRRSFSIGSKTTAVRLRVRWDGIECTVTVTRT